MSGMEWIPLAAAATSTAGGMYAANQANSTNAGNAYTSNMTNMFMQAQNQGYNAAEAVKGRDFNMGEAQKQRDWSADMAHDTQRYNTSEALKQRDWSENMSNTAYQRAVGDMKAAGLNPMLAYSQGGAGTPSAASASAASPSGTAASGPTASSGGWAGAQTAKYTPINLGSIMSSALDLQQKEANIKQTNTQTRLTEEQATGLGYTNRVTANTIQDLIEEIKVRVEDKHFDLNVKLDVEKEIRKAFKLANDVKSGEIGQLEASTKYIEIREKLAKLGVAEAEASEKYYKTFGMTDKVLNTAGQAIGNATGIGRLANTLKTSPRPSAPSTPSYKQPELTIDDYKTWAKQK